MRRCLDLQVVIVLTYLLELALCTYLYVPESTCPVGAKYSFQLHHDKVYKPPFVRERHVRSPEDFEMCDSLCAGLIGCDAVEVDWKSNTCTFLKVAEPVPKRMTKAGAHVTTKLKMQEIDCTRCPSPLITGVPPLPDQSMSVTSAVSGHNHSFSRLLSASSRGWVTSQQTGQYIQADFGKQVRLSAVATQGHNYASTSDFVTEYRVELSNDGLTWTKYTENGQTKVFRGNSDRNTVVKNNLAELPRTRFVRLVPTQFVSRIGLRWEVYGYCN